MPTPGRAGLLAGPIHLRLRELGSREPMPTLQQRSLPGSAGEHCASTWHPFRESGEERKEEEGKEEKEEEEMRKRRGREGRKKEGRNRREEGRKACYSPPETQFHTHHIQVFRTVCNAMTESETETYIPLLLHSQVISYYSGSSTGHTEDSSLFT